MALQLLSAHSTQISGVATEATSQKPFGAFKLRTFCDLSHVCNPHVTNDTLSVLSNIENITSQQILYITEAAIKAIQALVNFQFVSEVINTLIMSNADVTMEPISSPPDIEKMKLLSNDEMTR